jgi:hypothetical protein
LSLKPEKKLNLEQGRIMLCTTEDHLMELFETAGFASFMPMPSSIVSRISMKATAKMA